MTPAVSSISAINAVFKALAHPARREILALLAAEPRSVKELTAAFAISQPAVSQHLKELRDADLVASERIGAEQRYRLTPRPLKHLLDWSDRYRTLIDPQGHAWTFVPNPGKPSASASQKPTHPKKRIPRRSNDGR